MDLRAEVPLTIEAVLERIKEAETYYISLEKLAFKKANTANAEKIKLRKDNTTLSFINKFFEKFNKEYTTYYEGSGNNYCSTETRRSIGDVFRAAYCYLGSKIKLTDVIVLTYNKVLAGEICGNYCYQINKRVYKERGPNKNGQYYDPNYSDELGFKQAHYQLLLKHHKTT